MLAFNTLRYTEGNLHLVKLNGGFFGVVLKVGDEWEFVNESTNLIRSTKDEIIKELQIILNKKNEQSKIAFEKLKIP